MSAIAIAMYRSRTVEDPDAFLLAFHAGQVAADSDEDTALFLWSLLENGRASSAAGFIEGLAATNAQRTPAGAR